MVQGRNNAQIDPSLGVMNSGWGICGFTSTFYAIYHLDPGKRAWLVNATHAYSVLWEIKDYLESIKGTQLELDIEAFTKSFGPPYHMFSCLTYVGRIKNASSSLMESDDIKDNPLFGIALPPIVVVDYIKRVWGKSARIIDFASGPASLSNAIVGVTEDIASSKPYHGLCHYLYRGKHKYYSWGQEFSSLRLAMGTVGMPNAAICYAIVIDP